MTARSTLLSPTAVAARREPSSSIDRFLEHSATLSTPFLVLDLDVVESRYLELLAALPVSRVLYAVKANPAPEVLLRLNETWTCGSGTACA